MKFSFTLTLKDKRQLKYSCEADSKEAAQRKAQKFQEKIEGQSLAAPRGHDAAGFYIHRAILN